MTHELIHSVERQLLPALQPFGFSVVSSDVAAVFDNASVVLEAAPVRIRIVRERSIVTVDFGPSSHPGTWFDSAVLLEYMDLTPSGGFSGPDVPHVLDRVATFLPPLWNELRTIFSSEGIDQTIASLRALQEERGLRLFGE